MKKSALFFLAGLLVIEKLLKAYYIRTKDESYPMIHNLLRIAEKAGLDLNEEQQIFFSTLTGFNINARYVNLCCQKWGLYRS